MNETLPSALLPTSPLSIFRTVHQKDFVTHTCVATCNAARCARSNPNSSSPAGQERHKAGKRRPQHALQATQLRLHPRAATAAARAATTAAWAAAMAAWAATAAARAATAADCRAWRAAVAKMAHLAAHSAGACLGARTRHSLLVHLPKEYPARRSPQAGAANLRGRGPLLDTGPGSTRWAPGARGAAPGAANWGGAAAGAPCWAAGTSGARVWSPVHGSPQARLDPRLHFGALPLALLGQRLPVQPPISAPFGAHVSRMTIMASYADPRATTNQTAKRHDAAPNCNEEQCVAVLPISGLPVAPVDP
mmetsp:Transcript_142827/g.397862  ORF Transcript_142827/g.397862 Transcript_142827/m.397862 type:complete len:307 (+) Transcript_142827:10-930(+)